MKAPRLEYIELIGKNYPMCFTPAVVETLESEFGNLNEITNGLSGEGKQMKTFNSMLDLLIDAGIRYAKIAGIDCPDPLPCRAADLIDMTDPETVQELMQLITRTISAGSSRTVEAKSKNLTAAQEG